MVKTYISNIKYILFFIDTRWTRIKHLIRHGIFEIKCQNCLQQKCVALDSSLILINKWKIVKKTSKNIQRKLVMLLYLIQCKYKHIC